MDSSIAIAQSKLQQDPLLSQHVNPQNSHPFGVVSQNTYILLQGKYYEQIHGAAMGYLISPLIANLFMEEFEVKATNTAPTPLDYGSGL